MPAARYWRATGISAYAGGDVELSAFHLLAGSTPGSSDPLFGSTTLLMNFDGSHIDYSPSPQSLTVLNGSPTFSSTIKKYGSQSGDFRRTGSLLIPSGMDFGTGDFTVECWIYWNTASGVTQWGAFQLSTPSGYSASNQTIALLANTGSTYAFYCGGTVTTSTPITTGQWAHIAISRSAGTVRFFVDGTQIASIASSFDFAGASGVIGGYFNSTFNGDVLIDDFRVTKGVGRYTANFTPPGAVAEGGGALVRADQTATLSCAFAPISGALSNLQDADTTTTARFDPRSPGFALVWDFGAGNTADIQSAGVGSATSRDRFLSHYDLQYSSDGQNWIQWLRQGRFDWPGSNAMQTPTPGDPNFTSVAVLLYGNGPNGSTTFTDSGPSAKTITAFGNAQISTAQSKFGGSSAFFDGSGDYLETPSSADFSFGTGDFCIEFWSHRTATKGDCIVLHNTNDASASGGWWINFAGDTFSFVFSGSAVISVSNAQTAGSVFKHWAIARESGTVRVFRDGVLIGSAASSQNLNSSLRLQIGGSTTLGGFDGWFNGYIDDLRITKGVARYTASFTPPSSEFSTGSGNGIIAIPRLATRVGTPEAFAASPPVGAVSGRSVANPRNVRDLQYAGRGRISGTVKEDIDPVDRPVRRRVRLVRDRDGIVVRETWSDPTTGAYEFNEIDENATYSAISYDHTNNYRAVIADNLTPTVP